MPITHHDIADRLMIAKTWAQRPASDARLVVDGDRRVDGMSLRLYRTAADVSLSDVAGAMGRPRQSVFSIEQRGASMSVALDHRAAVDAVAIGDTSTLHDDAGPNAGASQQEPER